MSAVRLPRRAARCLPVYGVAAQGARSVSTQNQAKPSPSETFALRSITVHEKVVVRFVIDPAGVVASVQSIPGTTMPDARVTSCVIDEYVKLRFPKPAGGQVGVVYPIAFSPG